MCIYEYITSNWDVATCYDNAAVAFTKSLYTYTVFYDDHVLLTKVLWEDADK